MQDSYAEHLANQLDASREEVAKLSAARDANAVNMEFIARQLLSMAGHEVNRRWLVLDTEGRPVGRFHLTELHAREARNLCQSETARNGQIREVLVLGSIPEGGA